MAFELPSIQGYDLEVAVGVELQIINLKPGRLPCTNLQNNLNLALQRRQILIIFLIKHARVLRRG